MWGDCICQKVDLFRHHITSTEAPKALHCYGASGGMLPWGSFAIMGLRTALCCILGLEFGGKYNTQGVKCGPSAIGGGVIQPLQPLSRLWAWIQAYTQTCICDIQVQRLSHILRQVLLVLLSSARFLLSLHSFYVSNCTSKSVTDSQGINVGIRQLG